MGARGGMTRRWPLSGYRPVLASQRGVVVVAQPGGAAGGSLWQRTMAVLADAGVAVQVAP